MDACTASTLRVLLVLTVIAMAAMGLWSANKKVFCSKSADKRRCAIKSFAISAGVIAAGIFLTTLVIMRSDRVDLESPSTTDLLNNLA